MNYAKDQEEWMLVKQRQRKSRSQSLPQAAIGLEIGQRGARILNATGSKKLTNYVQKIPPLIQLQHQNPPCKKLDCNEKLFESPSPEIKRKNKKEADGSRRIGTKTYRDANLLSLEKDREIRSSTMSTLQLPDSGNKDEQFSNLFGKSM